MLGKRLVDELLERGAHAWLHAHRDAKLGILKEIGQTLDLAPAQHTPDALAQELQWVGTLTFLHAFPVELLRLCCADLGARNADLTWNKQALVEAILHNRDVQLAVAAPPSSHPPAAAAAASTAKSSKKAPVKVKSDAVASTAAAGAAVAAAAAVMAGATASTSAVTVRQGFHSTTDGFVPKTPKPYRAKKRTVNADKIPATKRPLEECDTAEEIFHYYWLEEMRVWCRSRRLSTSGTKKALIKRILDYNIEQGSAVAASSLAAKRVLSGATAGGSAKKLARGGQADEHGSAFEGELDAPLDDDDVDAAVMTGNGAQLLRNLVPEAEMAQLRTADALRAARLRHESRAWRDDADIDLRDVVIVLLGQFARTRKEMQLLIEQNAGQVRTGTQLVKAAAAIGINPFQYAFPHTFAYFYSLQAAGASAAAKRKRPAGAAAAPAPSSSASIATYVQRQMRTLNVTHPFLVTDRVLDAVRPDVGPGPHVGYAYFPYALSEQPGRLDDLPPVVPYYEASGANSPPPPSKRSAAPPAAAAVAAAAAAAPLRLAAVANVVEALPVAAPTDAVTHVVLGYVDPADFVAASIYDVARRMPWINIVTESWLTQTFV